MLYCPPKNWTCNPDSSWCRTPHSSKLCGLTLSIIQGFWTRIGSDFPLCFSRFWKQNASMKLFLCDPCFHYPKYLLQLVVNCCRYSFWFRDQKALMELLAWEPRSRCSTSLMNFLVSWADTLFWLQSRHWYLDFPIEKNSSRTMNFSSLSFSIWETVSIRGRRGR